jgi:drug/metabolite transporter (DMT)-like permease
LTVWLRVLRTLRAYEASILATLGVVFTALFAIPILGEQLEVHELAGIGCMLIGLSLAQFRRAVYSRRSFKR